MYIPNLIQTWETERSGFFSLAPTQEVAQKALTEKDELWIIEQDASIPKIDFPELTLRTRSNRKHASASWASHSTSTSVDSTSKEMMDSMTRLHLRMDL